MKMDTPFIDIDLNNLVPLISAACVCAQENNVKGLMDVGIQLGFLLGTIEKRLRRKENA